MADPIPFPKTPLPPASMIEEAQVSITRLKQVLDGAFIDSEIEPEGDLYISQGLDFPIWVSLDRERKLLNPYSCIGVRQPAQAGYLELNDLNKKLIMAKFHLHDGALWGNTWITYDGGLLARQFVMVLRRFANVFLQATNEACMAEFFKQDGEA